MSGLSKTPITTAIALLVATMATPTTARAQCSTFVWERVAQDSAPPPSMRLTFRSGARCPDDGRLRVYTDHWIDIPIARLWLFGDSIRLSTTAGGAPLAFAGHGEEERINGTLQAGGRTVPIAFRRVDAAAPDTALIGGDDPQAFRWPIPSRWVAEELALPDARLPGVDYRGAAVTRVPPGFAKPDDPRHWAYALVWWLDGSAPRDTASLARALSAYYRGVAVAMGVAASTADSVTTATMTTAHDSTRFDGAVRIADPFSAGRPLELHASARVVGCGTSRRTAVVIGVSPRAASAESSGRDVHALLDDFHCS